MAEKSVDPLDDAIGSVQRDLGEPLPLERVVDAFAAAAEDTPPPPKKPGRKPDPNSRRSRAGKYAAQGVAPEQASGKVSDPPIPEKPKFEPIKAESVAESIKQLDAIVVKMMGTVPLSNEEAQGGGAVFAPVLDHYMPMLADKGGMWLPAVTWIVLVYGPRAYEVLDRRQQAMEAKKRGQPVEAQARENGKDNFPRKDVDPARPFSVVTR